MDHRSRHSVATQNGGVREQVKATVKNVLRRKRDDEDVANATSTPRSTRRQSSTEDLGDDIAGRHWNQLFRRHHNKDNISSSTISSPPDSGGAPPSSANRSVWKKAIHKIHNRADSDLSTKATDSRVLSTSPSVQPSAHHSSHHAAPGARSSTSFHSEAQQPVARTSVARVAAVSTDSSYYATSRQTERSLASGAHYPRPDSRGARADTTRVPQPNSRTSRKTGVSEVIVPRVRGASRPREVAAAAYPATPPGSYSKAPQSTTPPTSASGPRVSATVSMLTEKGTPADLTRFFETKPWTPSRFSRIQRLAPAIHGEVSLYHDNLLNRDVVVKQLANSSVRPRGPQELENPLVEIGAMTYLFSDKALYPVDMVARLEGVYQDSHHTYMVSEYCSEGELFKEVVRRKNLSERHVKAIALQLALALYSLHRNGICHRDVSLENTLIQADHTVRLIDFGQAECCYEPDGSLKLMHGSAGKAYYRAPEMLRGPYSGPPVDVFALGVEIFIMAIGSPPWAKACLQDQRYRSLTKYRTSLDISLRKWGKRDGLSDAFVDILSTIFTSNPKQRPTIEQLLCHPWFSYDASVWTWVDQRRVSCTIRDHAVRVEMYLKSHPQGAIDTDEQAEK